MGGLRANLLTADLSVEDRNSKTPQAFNSTITALPTQKWSMWLLRLSTSCCRLYLSFLTYLLPVSWPLIRYLTRTPQVLWKCGRRARSSDASFLRTSAGPAGIWASSESYLFIQDGTAIIAGASWVSSLPHRTSLLSVPPPPSPPLPLCPHSPFLLTSLVLYFLLGSILQQWEGKWNCFPRSMAIPLGVNFQRASEWRDVL